VHDYHLMLVAKELRAMGMEQKVGYFLHIPFPPPDIFIKLPWRLQILKALMEYDLVGFQTLRDRNNFIHCAETLIKGISADTRRQVSTIIMQDREIKVGIFPISIDFNGFDNQAADKLVAERANQLYEAIPNCQIVLGVDRLDHSKGIPQRLLAFDNALERFPELRGKIALILIVVPSRVQIPGYKEIKSEIEGMVSKINGRYTQSGWIPVHYMFRNLRRTELLAYYRAAEISLITPLKDGMNLVAKEYCAANRDNNGVLILSEFAGAAAQLSRSSLLVNPYDIVGMANAIHRAYHMSPGERRSRMRRMRLAIRKRDIFWWVSSFLRTALDQGGESSVVSSILSNVTRSRGLFTGFNSRSRVRGAS
jgi:trehalose 6-phosphate synthase